MEFLYFLVYLTIIGLVSIFTIAFTPTKAQREALAAVKDLIENGKIEKGE